MQSTWQDRKTRDGIHTFVRNRYFYGKLLDVFHFELEQDYLNGKRWLLNRLVTGYGVLCGLDVQPAQKGRAVVVTPGVALDRGGREIIVPRTSDPIDVPPRPPQQQQQRAESGKYPAGHCEPEDYVHLCVSFQQCEGDPAPVLVDDCGQATSCSASSIQERYKFVIRECKAPDIDLNNGVPDFLLNGRLNYYALVERVTRACPELPSDLCVPLANIRLPEADDDPLQTSDIDISPRPIVYSNDLLFDMIIALAGEAPARHRGGKK
ncbi:MAG TPA: hypothetical protein VJ715_15660 [Pyrinomonadaceae bacterium]|nr:hypothetical protein [Pyrinomonadaceae bacterium]